MRKAIYCLALLALITQLTIIACTPAKRDISPATEVTVKPEIPVKPPWQVEWDKIVSGARQEGKIRVYTSLGVAVRTIMGEALKNSYGLELEFVSGRTAEVLAKIAAERRAGLYLADTYIGGSTSQIQLKETGVIQRIEPLLILPEVLDRNIWQGGEMLFLDRDRLILVFASQVNRPIVINKELVSPSIKLFREILEPRWKGKILMHDPTQSGAGALVITVVGELHGEDLIRQLAKQEPAIVRDIRTHMEWVARGKYAIGTGPYPEMIMEFTKAGAPVATPIPADLAFTTAGSALVSLLDRPAHPNAARLFLNWLLTKEGQTAYVRGMGVQSERLDVTTEYTLPEAVRQPGVKYFSTETEELVYKRFYYQNLSKEIFGQLLK